MKLKIEYVAPATLTEYRNNARIHPEAQIQQLMKSISQFGFNVPVLIRPDLTIVAGHGRVEAARRLGLDQIPAIRIDHLTDEQVRAFTLADNKIQLNAAWDFEKLSAELNSLVEADFDISIVGFDNAELDNLLAESFSILPEVRWQQDAIPPVPERPAPGPAPVQYSQSPAPEPAPAAPQTPQAPPTAPAEQYSNFEMLMLHQNKVELVERLSNVRNVMGFPKLEDALMHVVRAFNME